MKNRITIAPVFLLVSASIADRVDAFILEEPVTPDRGAKTGAIAGIVSGPVLSTLIFTSIEWSDPRWLSGTLMTSIQYRMPGFGVPENLIPIIFVISLIIGAVSGLVLGAIGGVIYGFICEYLPIKNRIADGIITSMLLCPPLYAVLNMGFWMMPIVPYTLASMLTWGVLVGAMNTSLPEKQLTPKTPRSRPKRPKSYADSIADLESRTNRLMKKDKAIYVKDLKKLIEKAKREPSDKMLMKARRLFKEKERMLNRRIELTASFKEIDKAIEDMSLKLAKGEIGERAYEEAVENLKYRKVEIQDELGEIDYKLYKEEYEKPIF